MDTEKCYYKIYYQLDIKLIQTVAVLQWGHNLLLINKIKDSAHAEFYANEFLP